MPDIFFTSDTHFDHANFLNFTDDAGEKVRPHADVDEMNEVMIQNWNAVVKNPTAKVYHLGDVTFKPNKFARIATRLNGHKRLLLGNHDDGKNFELTRWFEKVQVWRIFKDEGFVCTHIPIPYDQFRHKVQYNVHGHLHQNLVKNETTGLVDTRYVNICVEHTNYTPIHMDEVIARCKRRA